MSEREKMAIIEAILFTMGEAVELDKIAEVIEEDQKTTKKIIESLIEEMEADHRGVFISRINNSYQMCTKANMYDYLIKIAKVKRKYVLSETLLETLSIVAYKQPVTKLDVEKIRGVNCDHAVNRLVEFGLVKELGRLDAPGRPLLFGTTEEFLRSFGVKSLEELPSLNPVKVEEFKEEAKAEIELQLSV
ncbi:MAG: SMC-Scp complex subunit ScpB [Lachnospiraceae bacterium]